MNGRYQGKRFAGFILSCGLLFAGLYAADTNTFGSFAQYLALMYGAYLTGQSATDYVKAKNGN